MMKGAEFNNWKCQIFHQYNRIQEQVGETDFKKYKLDVSCRALNKISPYALKEEDFSELKRAVTETLNAIPQENICKTTLRPYSKEVKNLKQYLKNNFNLIPCGHHSIKWVIIGIGFGIPYSYFLSSLLGIFIGFGIGIGIGTYLDKKAERENKAY